MTHQDVALNGEIRGISIVHRCEERGLLQAVGDLAAGLGQDLRRGAFESNENEPRGHAIAQLATNNSCV